MRQEEGARVAAGLWRGTHARGLAFGLLRPLLKAEGAGLLLMRRHAGTSHSGFGQVLLAAIWPV